MKISHPREIIGKTDFDFMQTDRAQAYYDSEQDMFQTGEAIIDLEIMTQESSDDTRWYLTSKSPIYDSDAKCVGLIGINRDITRQKLAEKTWTLS